VVNYSSLTPAFDKVLEDDLNTPRALAELWGLLRDNSIEPKAALAAALDMDKVLGLGLESQLAAGQVAKDAHSTEDAGLIREIEALIAERAAAKQAKDFARADQLRQSLKDRGILLEDSPDGTKWRRM
jgi:cysteinyl-tRNA synthetase